jgi:hypothetical protein
MRVDELTATYQAKGLTRHAAELVAAAPANKALLA